jgi:hypothetical protein
VQILTTTFKTVWYRNKPQRWLPWRTYQDVGTLFVSEGRVEFQANQEYLIITEVSYVSFGIAGHDYLNRWAKLRYRSPKGERDAFFADGRNFGWRGILGGTRRIFASLQSAFPVAAGEGRTSL